MINAFKVLWKTIKDIWEDMLLLVLMNVVTVVAGIPFFAAIGIPAYLGLTASTEQGSPLISMLMIALVLSIPASIPYAGALFSLYDVCNRVANGFAINWEYFWTSFRQNIWKSWRYFIFTTAITILIIINFLWYPQAFTGQEWVGWVMGAWLAALIFWSSISFYVYPFYMEQENKSWRVALKNAALVAGANPLFTFILFVVAVALSLVSLVLIPPLSVLIGIVFWVMIGTQAVVNRVAAYRLRMEADAAKTKPPSKH